MHYIKKWCTRDEYAKDGGASHNYNATGRVSNVAHK